MVYDTTFEERLNLFRIEFPHQPGVKVISCIRVGDRTNYEFSYFGEGQFLSKTVDSVYMLLFYRHVINDIWFNCHITDMTYNLSVSSIHGASIKKKVKIGKEEAEFIDMFSEKLFIKDSYLISILSDLCE